MMENPWVQNVGSEFLVLAILLIVGWLVSCA